MITYLMIAMKYVNIDHKSSVGLYNDSEMKITWKIVWFILLNLIFHV